MHWFSPPTFSRLFVFAIAAVLSTWFAHAEEVQGLVYPLKSSWTSSTRQLQDGRVQLEKGTLLENIDQLLVQFYLSPRFLQTLQVMQPITVRLPDIDNVSVKGEIQFIDPRIDASSGLFRVKVLLDNKDHKVKPGLKAMADFSKHP